MSHTIFIDGQEGTTGLEIYQKLECRSGLELLEIDSEHRKNPAQKRSLYEQADVVVLCLPDDAAKEAVALTRNTRFLDASTAHRTHPDWTYGLPELCRTQRPKIENADRVSNPGCYPTGFILLVRPLIDSQLLEPSAQIKVHALSGYSGGGKKLIAKYKNSNSAGFEVAPYGMSLAHKHLPEMQHYSGLNQAPLFEPTVGAFYKGMLVQIPLFTNEFMRETSPEQLVDIYQESYANEQFIKVHRYPADNALEDGFLSAQTTNDTNRVEILVFGREDQVVLTARLDNLGKGASSAAVQNLNLMLKLEEGEGLTA